MVFLADPQIIDPHTYPGRPWPLSSLTVAFTDKYLGRSYRILQRTLDPDTLLFLGDLFDGGREWGTHGTGFTASEERWKKYGQQYWLGEYERFGNMFFDPLQISGGQAVAKSRKIIATLPGNHDLGFGMGVQTPVRKRFHAFFGEGDRVDVIGNHTFVSLDTLSLSAMGQPNSKEAVWKPTMDFLDQVREGKARAVQHELLHGSHDKALDRKYTHAVTYPQDMTRAILVGDVEKAPGPELPTILLTHVPFFREPGTPCGPQRERHPPSGPNLRTDEPNAISVSGGFQYQNVLTREISTMIAEKIGSLVRVFSGDDHDYCELVHQDYVSAGAGIREVTVKSMSWAMGVRKPGFLLASLWNPIDENGLPLNDNEKTAEATVQTHLCLLPDQLGIFIRYLVCLGLTLAILVARALIMAQMKGQDASSPSSPSSPVLPSFEPSRTRATTYGGRPRAASTSANSPSSNSGNMLSSRSGNGRMRNVSPGDYAPPLNGHGPNAPLIEQAGYYSNRDDTDEWGYPTDKKALARMHRPRGFMARALRHLYGSLLWVACPVLLWYYWLMRNG